MENYGKIRNFTKKLHIKKAPILVYSSIESLDEEAKYDEELKFTSLEDYIR